MNFNYNTINVSLKPESRSIKVELNRPNHNNRINIEMLFELEGLFSWLTSHLEVNAVELTGAGDYFSAGFDIDELKLMSEEKLHKYLIRFQKLILGMFCLPQTIICDLKGGASGMGIELALGADIRVARNSGELHFNALKTGQTPCGGGVGLLNIWVGQGCARSWNLSSKKVSANEAYDKSLVSNLYGENENACEEILTNITKQAPVARIQCKRSFLESIHPELIRTFEFESVFAFATFKTQDWKKNPESEQFVSAREMAQVLKSKTRSAPDHLSPVN